MTLKWDCAQHVAAVAVGCVALAAPGAAAIAGPAVGAAALLGVWRKAKQQLGLDDRAIVAAAQEAAREGLERLYGGDWAAMADLNAADRAMVRHLADCVPERAQLAELILDQARYPAAAAVLVVDRLATRDPLFAEAGQPGASEPARRFALTVIESALKTALDNPDYAQAMMPHMLAALGQGVATVVATTQGIAATQDDHTDRLARIEALLSAQHPGLPEPALGGAINRFIAFAPGASEAEVIEAVERFVPEYEALRQRIDALDAADNRLRGAQQAAVLALDQGDLDAARRHLAEAADVTVDRAADAVREAAAQIGELARADLLALDWEAADRNWARAEAMLMAFDTEAAARVTWQATAKLLEHGQVFGARGALDAAIRRASAMRERLRGTPEQFAFAAWSNLFASACQLQGDRIGGTDGVALLTGAVAAHEDALTVYTRETTPAQWAMTQNNLGNTLGALGAISPESKGRVLLDRATSAFEHALTIHTPDAMPHEWALTQSNLAAVFHSRGERTGGTEACTFFARAAAACDDALTIYTRHAAPVDWAMTQGMRANALAAQGERTIGTDGLELLTRSIESYRELLSILTHDAMPARWAIAQRNLANALCALGKRTAGEGGTTLLAEAIGAYQAALTVCTRDAMPSDWASTECGLASAVAALGRRTEGPAGLALINRAVAIYDEALSVRVQAAMPVAWAETQNNLAILLRGEAERTGGESGRDLLARVVKAYEGAALVFSEEQMPVQEAMARNNLAIALTNQAAQTPGAAGLALLERVIDEYGRVISVLTREAAPALWAAASSNLAVALAVQATRIEGERTVRLLEQAVAAHQDALTVLTRDANPEEWALAKANLAGAYYLLAHRRSDPVPDLHCAEVAVKEALPVHDAGGATHARDKALRLLEDIQAAIAASRG